MLSSSTLGIYVFSWDYNSNYNSQHY